MVDPGFGGYSGSIPIPLDGAVAACAGGYRHWISQDRNAWVLRAEFAAETIDGWVCAFEADNDIDFEMGNHFTATHPSSPFVNMLMLSARGERQRVNVMNRDVTILRDGRR